MNIEDRPTPETDAHMAGGSYSFTGEHARRLERQRDAAIEAVELLIATSNWPKACEQARATLAAIKAL